MTAVPACLTLAPTTLAFSSAHRGASLIRKRTLLGPYRSPVPGVLGGSYRGVRFLMSGVSLYNKALLAFSTDREAEQLVKDCPAHANSTSHASKAEYHRTMNETDCLLTASPSP